VTDRPAALAVVMALLIQSATLCVAAASEAVATLVELETPLASAHALQALIRQPAAKGPSPAVVLLSGCNGDWRQLDEHWGKLIAGWGYVTLTLDSFGPRGLQNTCGGGMPADLARDAYRALDYLVKEPLVDSARVAALGFSQGGWLALSSVERGTVEQNSPNKFRSAIGFYPPCLTLSGDMTVPTLILTGELDDWTPAVECRNLVEGRDDFGISRRKGNGVPIRLIVYGGAYHVFDNPRLRAGVQYFGHHLEYNQAATDQSVDALRDFLYLTLRATERDAEPAR
jgi:dienelactone hydrolase